MSVRASRFVLLFATAVDYVKRYKSIRIAQPLNKRCNCSGGPHSFNTASNPYEWYFNRGIINEALSLVEFEKNRIFCANSTLERPSMEFGKKTLLLGGTCIVNRKVMFKDILPSFINQSHNHILCYSVHIPQTLQFIIASLVSDRRNLRLLAEAAPPHEKLREQLKPLSAAQISLYSERLQDVAQEMEGK